MLSAGETVPEFLKAAHTHTLLISILLFLPVYDWRLKNLEYKIRIAARAGALVIFAGTMGLLISTIGFSAAGLYPSMTGTGLSLVGAGEAFMFLAFFAYIIIAIIEEAYK